MFSVRTRTCFANENAETKNLSSSQAGVLLENTDVGLCREAGKGEGVIFLLESHFFAYNKTKHWLLWPLLWKKLYGCSDFVNFAYLMLEIK